MRALVRASLGDRRGVMVWVDQEGVVRVLGAGGRQELEGLAWALDVAYRLGGRGAVGVGEKARLSSLRRVAHHWAEASRRQL